MSTNENSAVTDTDDLDAFSADFFGQKTATPEPASSEEDQVETPEDDATNEEDTHLGEDDTPANDEPEDNTEEDGEEDEEETPEPKPEPVKKRSRAQERIEELNAKYRETERKLAEVMAKLEQKETPASTNEQVVVEDNGPTPEDKLEDGTEKYPLGEFDPNYIRDLTKFTIQQEREAVKQAEIQDQRQKAIQDQKAALAVEWEGKLGPARERYPDFREKGEELISQFDGIDQSYGEYLTATIMSMDYGTDVLYHLASNPDEAKAIVASGPTKATIALGRLEAKYADADAEKQLARPKVSKAPAPPAHVNKGSAVAKPAVAPDTDDLDAFASEFFKKKGR